MNATLLSPGMIGYVLPALIDIKCMSNTSQWYATLLPHGMIGYVLPALIDIKCMSKASIPYTR